MCSGHRSQIYIGNMVVWSGTMKHVTELKENLALVLSLTLLPGGIMRFHGQVDTQTESDHIHLPFEPLPLGILFLVLGGALPHPSSAHSQVFFVGSASPPDHGVRRASCGPHCRGVLSCCVNQPDTDQLAACFSHSPVSTPSPHASATQVSGHLLSVWEERGALIRTHYIPGTGDQRKAASKECQATERQLETTTAQ